MVRCAGCNTCTLPGEKPVQVVKGYRTFTAATFPGGPLVEVEGMRGIAFYHVGCLRPGMVTLS